MVGKYQTSIPKVGTFFQFLKTTPGYIVCILLPFLLLILMEGIRCIRLFRRYKKEQQTELQKERDQLREEREETQRMMQELMEMKQKLNGTAAPADTAAAASAAPTAPAAPAVPQQTAPVQQTAAPAEVPKEQPKPADGLDLSEYLDLIKPYDDNSPKG